MRPLKLPKALHSDSTQPDITFQYRGRLQPESRRSGQRFLDIDIKIGDRSRQPPLSREPTPPSGITMPSLSPHDSDYDADIEVVKPYAVEEPDDEPTAQPQRHVVSSLPDHFERWHVDLIGSMEDLSCEPETDSPRSEQRRGQKRKPATTGASHLSSSHLGSKHSDVQHEGPSLSRKRPRRRTRRPKDGLKFDHGSSSNASYSTESYRSSSSAAPRSTDGSGTETGDLNSTTDSEKMDID